MKEFSLIDCAISAMDDPENYQMTYLKKEMPFGEFVGEVLIAQMKIDSLIDDADTAEKAEAAMKAAMALLSDELVWSLTHHGEMKNPEYFAGMAAELCARAKEKVRNLKYQISKEDGILDKVKNLTILTPFKIWYDDIEEISCVRIETTDLKNDCIGYAIDHTGHIITDTDLNKAVRAVIQAY